MTLTPTERAILVDLVVFGDDKAENIANRVGSHRNTVSKYMRPLSEQGYIEGKGGGVYRPTDKGRETGQGLILAGDIPYSKD